MVALVASIGGSNIMGAHLFYLSEQALRHVVT